MLPRVSLIRIDRQFYNRIMKKYFVLYKLAIYFYDITYNMYCYYFCYIIYLAALQPSDHISLAAGCMSGNKITLSRLPSLPV